MEAIARTVRSAVITTAALLAFAPAALAQSPTPTPTPVPPAPTPTPTPAPVPAQPAQLLLAVKAPLHSGKRAVALRGDRVKLTGAVTPFVAGQKAEVRVRLKGHKVLTRRVAIKAGPNGTGAFRLSVRVWKTGSLTFQARHKATAQQLAGSSAASRVLVLRPSASYGSSGTLVRMLQRRLHALRYEARVTGRYDDATARAVLAWRKVNARARLYSADKGVVRRVLAGKGGWKVRHPGAGHHVEADISRQALALIDGKRVQHVYPTSSGKPSTPTVLGTYRFYSKTPGTNAEGMVDSNYFIRGYAIHGYADVPTYNASHGCLRIPIPDARTAYNWIRLGDRIFVEP